MPNKHPVQHPPSSSRVATCSRRADDARQSQQLGFGNWELPSWETLGAGRRAAGLLRWPGGRRRRRDRGRREPERRKAGDGQRLDGRRRAGHAGAGRRRIYSAPSTGSSPLHHGSTGTRQFWFFLYSCPATVSCRLVSQSEISQLIMVKLRITY